MALTALDQTLAAGGAVIVAGLVTDRWQGRQTAKIAARIRREERQEEALLELNGRLTYVTTKLLVMTNLGLTPPAWVGLAAECDQVIRSWHEHYSGRVVSKEMRTLYKAVEDAYEPVHDTIQGKGTVASFVADVQALRDAIDTFRHRVDEQFLED